MNGVSLQRHRVFSLDERPSEEEQQRRLEVFLKFWLWNAEAKEWQLVTGLILLML
jgi:hypothetical protein